jgi:ABC-type phosphate transport system substrate-binding protein
MTVFVLPTVLLAIVFLTFVGDIRASVSGATQLVALSSPISRLPLADVALAYQLPVPGVVIQVQSGGLAPPPNIGAVEGLTVDWSMEEVGLTAQQSAEWPNLILLPSMVSAVVPVYRLDGFTSSATFSLSRSTLAAIFLGEITSWNDSRIAASNGAAAASLPNVSITVVLANDQGGADLAFTTALSKFSSTFNQTVGTSARPIWQLTSYAAYKVAMGASSVPSDVLATDGSIGFAPQSIALAAGVNIAGLVNLAGYAVTATSASVQAAATDLGTNFPSQQTQHTDLTDSGKAAAWPITVMSYFMLDVDLSRGNDTCDNRNQTVQFLLWYYTSSVVSSLFASRQAGVVPPIVLSELGLVAAITNGLLLCSGSKVPSATPTVMRTNSHGSQAVVIGAQLTSAYAAISPVQFVAETNTDVVVVEQMMQSSVDLGFMVPQNTNLSFWQQFAASEQYLILPLYFTALSFIVNPQLTANVSVPSGHTLLLDMRTQILIFYGCVNVWSDPVLTALNPWLSTLLNGTSPPISLFTGCGSTAATAPLALQLLVAMRAYLTADGIDDQVAQQCVTDYSAALLTSLQLCQGEVISGYLVRVSNEAELPALVLSTPGAVTYTQVTNNPSYLYPALVQGGLTLNSSLGGLAACGQSNFDSSKLWFNLGASTDPTCWPMNQELVAIVRRQYFSQATNASSCTRGLDALRYLQWLFINNNISPILEASNFLRLPVAFPSVQQAYVAALEAVTCDGITLLITLPTVWSLSSAVSQATYALSALGMMLCLCAMTVVLCFPRHPVIRSASPMFIVISLCGVLSLFAAAIVLVMSPSASTCSAMNWLWNIGFDLAFAPLFAKTWRIYQVTLDLARLYSVALCSRRCNPLFTGCLPS